METVVVFWKNSNISVLGTSVKFQNRFPSELESRIDRHTFESTINKLNEYFIEAEKGNCSTYCAGTDNWDLKR